jgi:hypothetical protein
MMRCRAISTYQSMELNSFGLHFLFLVNWYSKILHLYRYEYNLDMNDFSYLCRSVNLLCLFYRSEENTAT